MNTGNIIYLPRWLRVTFSVTLGVTSILGLVLLVDSLTISYFNIAPGGLLSFLQILLPSFAAFSVVAYGRKQMSTESINRFIQRFFECELADAIDVARPEGAGRMAIKRGGPYLKHLAFVSSKGAEFAIEHHLRLTWVRVWFDMSEFVVLLRLPQPSERNSLDQKNSYARDVERQLSYWVERYLEKSWRVKFRPSIQGLEDSDEMDYMEIWCFRNVTGEFLYDSLEQATVSHEVAAIIRGFLGDCSRLGIAFDVDASWLPDEDRRLVAPYVGRRRLLRRFLRRGVK